jgi:hypothetical protein
MPRPLLPLLGVIGLTVLLPLLGAVLGGEPWTQLIALPLSTRAWDPLQPSALATWLTGMVLLLAIALIAALAWPARPSGRKIDRRSPAPLPRYAWFGIFALIGTVIAVDGHAVNLAVGLITLALALFANADTQRRTGNSLIRQRPGYFLSLFPASLAMGWTFYWLNLFLQLWTYPAATEAAPFVLGKSVDYATLLPALLSLRQWLASWPPLLDWTTRARPIAGSAQGQEGWLLVGLAAAAITGASLWPDWIYPLTLLAPLLFAVGLQQIRGQPSLFAGLASGDWSRLLLPAAAALLIGIVAQACNAMLGPAWVFELPLIGGPSPFGLPLPAYVWMLPLGLLGIWIGDQLTSPWKERPQPPSGRRPLPVKIVIQHQREQSTDE